MPFVIDLNNPLIKYVLLNEDARGDANVPREFRGGMNRQSACRKIKEIRWQMSLPENIRYSQDALRQIRSSEFGKRLMLATA